MNKMHIGDPHTLAMHTSSCIQYGIAGFAVSTPVGNETAALTAIPSPEPTT